MEQVRKLCTPAYVYLVISVLTVIVMILQNLGNTNEYCVGAYTCEVPSTSLVFLLKGVSIAFWTIILNSLCQTGYRTLSWLLVILPFIGGALAIALLMMSGGIREGLEVESATYAGANSNVNDEDDNANDDANDDAMEINNQPNGMLLQNQMPEQIPEYVQEQLEAAGGTANN